MSDVWGEQERARRLAAGRRMSTLERATKSLGYVLGIVIMLLAVAGLGALVTLLWRKALGG